MVTPGVSLGARGVRKGVHVLREKIRKGRSLGAGKAHAAPRPKRRSRAMHMRKGRLFIGFTAKEIKNAMRRVYGGRRGKK